MATIIGLCLEPLDVLFFRDGRPFTGAERSVSGLPLPQTVAGAIRTALLRAANCDFRKLGEAMRKCPVFAQAVRDACTEDHHWIGEAAVRGPWLARHTCQDNDLEVLIPVPATLHREKRDPDKLHRLSPLPNGQLPGWNPPDNQKGLRPLWLKHLPATEPASGYLTRCGLERFLRGREVSAGDIVGEDTLFALDYRTGIGIAPDRLVAAESQIFGRGFLALKQDEGVCLYAEVEIQNDASDGAIFGQIKTIPLGGEGRHVILRRVRPFSWPEAKPRDKQRPLVLLITPCAFEAGWKPRVLDSRLVSAAVPGSLPFSGWDLARGGPKPTRFGVPAASVYFLNSLPENWARTLAESDEDRRQGWGCCLTGVWNDE
ncbi:MAG TPA: type III-B CRISPR module-associated protein Cmr3 [Phycisphaerae bacterium]|nr:type III-B CRISPR module-associated protein Cmr3 [Phycisphaerae bacterium]